jgi:hypothetical protein
MPSPKNSNDRSSSSIRIGLRSGSESSPAARDARGSGGVRWKIVVSVAGAALLSVFAVIGIVLIREPVDSKQVKHVPASKELLIRDDNVQPPRAGTNPSVASNPEIRTTITPAETSPEILPMPREAVVKLIVNEPEVLKQQPRIVVEVPPPAKASQTVATRPRPESTLEPVGLVSAPPPAVVEKPKPEVAAKLPETARPQLKLKTENFRTKVNFVPTPVEACEVAAKETDKLVMIVHTTGDFDKVGDAAMCVEMLREGALSNESVGEFVNEHFICSYQKVGVQRKFNGQRFGGNVVTYFCLADGTVLHAVMGPVTWKQFLDEATWIVDTLETAKRETKGDREKCDARIRKAHADRYVDEMKTYVFLRFPQLPANQIPKSLPTARPKLLPAPMQLEWMLASYHAPKLITLGKMVYQDLLNETFYHVPPRDR